MRKIIHIDIDPAEIGKNVRVDIPIVGDAKNILKNLADCKDRTGKDRCMGQEDKCQWKQEYPLTYKKDNLLRPQFVVEQISEICPDAIIVTEVGQNQMWQHNFLINRNPRTFISSGGLAPWVTASRLRWAQRLEKLNVPSSL